MAILHQTITVNEAAHYFRVQPKTVRAWIASGKLAARKIGKSYRIASEEISRVMGNDQPIPEKPFDPERAARIAALKEMLRASGITLEALEADRARDMELEKIRAREIGLQ